MSWKHEQNLSRNQNAKKTQGQEKLLLERYWEQEVH